MERETDDERLFGRLLKQTRVAKSIGLRDFAKRIGISPAYLSRIESGDDIPPVDEVIAKMAEVLKVSSHTLFYAANEVLRVHGRRIKQRKKQNGRRMPPEMYEAYKKSSVYSKRIPEFLRIAKRKNLNDAQWRKIIEALEKEANGE